MASNGGAEQTPEALSHRIAELCEMVDSIVSQVKSLFAFRFPPVHILTTSVINLLHGMAGAGTKKDAKYSLLLILTFLRTSFKSLP